MLLAAGGGRGGFAAGHRLPNRFAARWRPGQHRGRPADFHLPLVPLSLETLYIILPYSLILAAIGLIESLLT